MRLNTKVKNILKDKKLKTVDLHKRIVKRYGKKAIALNTLYRFLNGRHQLQDMSLIQISDALEMTPHGLAQGTGKAQNAFIVKYDQDSYLSCTLDAPLPFTGKLFVGSKSKTPKLQDTPISCGLLKFIMVLRGKLVCTVVENKEIKKYVLKKENKLAFDTALPHSFENPGKMNATALVLHIYAKPDKPRKFIP